MVWIWKNRAKVKISCFEDLRIGDKGFVVKTSPHIAQYYLGNLATIMVLTDEDEIGLTFANRTKNYLRDEVFYFSIDELDLTTFTRGE